VSMRLVIYITCAILALLAIPPSDPITWYVVHGIFGWIMFSCAAGLSYWLWRHPNAARPSPLTLILLAMAALAGFISS